MDKQRLRQRLRDLLSKIEKNKEDSELSVEELAYLYRSLDIYFFDEYKLLNEINRKLDTLLERSIQATCRFSDEDKNAISTFFYLSIASRNQALRFLKEKVAGTKRLIICDPYLLKSIKSMSAGEAFKAFSELLPASLVHLELYVKPRMRDKEIAQSINRYCKSKEIRLLVFKTEDIHDRVWIKDYESAFVVGTSFSGLGNRCAFILDLPKEDLREFQNALHELRSRARRSKAA